MHTSDQLGPRPVRGALCRAGRLARALARRFGEHDLLTYASAVAFQIQFALVPLTLAGLALLAFLGLEGIWTDRVAPAARDALPGDAYSLLERTAEHVLASQRLFWLTAGIALAIWQLSGALRATSGALNEIYEIQEERTLPRRLGTSLLLALAVAPCLLGATVLLGAGGQLIALAGLPAAGAVAAGGARWVVGIALLLLALWLVMRHAPARRRPARWVTVGSGLTVAGWLVASAAYGLYVSRIASYGSIFGALAAVIVFMTYLYIVTVVFLAGAQVDALGRDRSGR